MKTVDQLTAFLGNFRQHPTQTRRSQKPHLTSKNQGPMHSWRLLTTLGRMGKIGRQGLSQNHANRLSQHDLENPAHSQNGESPLYSPPLSDVPTQQEDISELREWAMAVAQDTSKESVLRRDIARLLFGMTTDQLETARQKLSEIFGTTKCPLQSAIAEE